MSLGGGIGSTGEFEERVLRISFGSEELLELTPDDSAKLQLYHLRSSTRLLVTSQVGKFGIQNSGLAFCKDSHTPKNPSAVLCDVFVFEPRNYTACFLPVMSGNSTLQWDNQAVVNVFRGELDASYWLTSTFLAHVNGVVYSNYLLWVSRYTQLKPRFYPHSICTTQESATSCVVASYTWDNFIEDSLVALSQLAVKMSAILPLRESKIWIISYEQPIPVTPAVSTNETLRKEVRKATMEFVQYQEQSNINNMPENDAHTRQTFGPYGMTARRRLQGRPRMQEAVDGSASEDDYLDADGDKLPAGQTEKSPDAGSGGDQIATEPGPGDVSPSKPGSDSSRGSSTNTTNSTQSNEWLVEQPQPNIFDRPGSQMKANVTDMDVVRFYLDLMTCMQGSDDLSVHLYYS
jgi:hypothetical protein